VEAGRGAAGALKRSEREELGQLRRENQRLRQERGILKKRRPSSPRRVSEIRFLEGWLYLAVVLDLFSRRVVGWSMSDSLDRRLALDALKMAVADRRPARGLVHHSDRGSQYASLEYQQLLAAHGIIGSMSRSGNCWDNAVAESFFATLKIELVYHTQWRTRAEARSEIFEYIELFYNRRRRHSAINYLSLDQFERSYHEEGRR
jgi:putative transposase